MRQGSQRPQPPVLPEIVNSLTFTFAFLPAKKYPCQ